MNKTGWFKKLEGFTRAPLRFITALYVLGGMILLFVTQMVGEEFWMTTLVLYSAPGFWLAPMLVLIPVALVVDRWLAVVCLALVPLFLCYHMGWQLPRGADTAKSNFNVLTNNVGQRGKTSFRKYQEKVFPDVILLQEVGGRIFKYERDFPGYHGASSGEFGILSRHPILVAEPVPGLDVPAASRFKVLVGKDVLVLYNVHLPTPRRNLQKLRGNGFLHSAFKGGGVFSSEVRKECQAFMDTNLRLARQLADAAAKEKHPVILAGDFNAPAMGRVARLMSEAFIDIHRDKGGGFGFTFPGVSRNPLSFFGPWMRIDHIYCSQTLRPVSCRVEPKRPSQHLAVAAGFDLSGH